MNEEHVLGFGLFALFGVSFLRVFVCLWFVLSFFFNFTNALCRASPMHCVFEGSSFT